MGLSKEPIECPQCGYHVAYLLRGGDDHNAFGDPYTWVMLALLLVHEAHLKGLLSQRQLDRGTIEHVVRVLKNVNPTLRWERMKNGLFKNREA